MNLKSTGSSLDWVRNKCAKFYTYIFNMPRVNCPYRLNYFTKVELHLLYCTHRYAYYTTTYFIFVHFSWPKFSRYTNSNKIYHFTLHLQFINIYNPYLSNYINKIINLYTEISKISFQISQTYVVMDTWY